jgi:hypothetical protein
MSINNIDKLNFNFSGSTWFDRQLRGAVHRADRDIGDRVVRHGAAADAGQHVQQCPLSRLRRHLHLPRNQSRRRCFLGKFIGRVLTTT